MPAADFHFRLRMAMRELYTQFPLVDSGLMNLSRRHRKMQTAVAGWSPVRGASLVARMDQSKGDPIRTDIQDESFRAFTDRDKRAPGFVDGYYLRLLWHVGHCSHMLAGEVESASAPICHLRLAVPSATVHGMPKRVLKTPAELKQDLQRFDRVCAAEFKKAMVRLAERLMTPPPGQRRPPMYKMKLPRITRTKIV
jgi:hypothetical protein